MSERDKHIAMLIRQLLDGKVIGPLERRYLQDFAEQLDKKP